jgi:hypothetical protein
MLLNVIVIRKKWGDIEIEHGCSIAQLYVSVLIRHSLKGLNFVKSLTNYMWRVCQLHELVRS